MTSKLDSHLKMFDPFIKAIVELFHPVVEAAVHDLRQGQLVAIYNNLSQKISGDFRQLLSRPVGKQAAYAKNLV